VPARQGPVPSRDEVFFSIARWIAGQSASPVSAVVNALGEEIEVGEIKPLPAGKATVVVKELAPSNSRATNKSIRLVFVPSNEPDKWNFESFEDNRRLYPVEKLIPYVKDNLTKKRAGPNAAWSAYLSSMIKSGAAAAKILETAKAIIKSDPAPTEPVRVARTSLAEALKGGETPVILNAFRELNSAIEPILTLAENHPDLKANDAYLRLLEELKASQAGVETTRKAYIDAVDVYNDEIRRLPYALVAYGLEFTKIESQIQP
jgi:LemA protein